MRRVVIFWICLLLLMSGLQAQQKQILPDIIKHKISLNTGLIQAVSTDTSITGSQNFHPLYSKFPAWSDMGNIGLPSLPLSFTGIEESNTPAFLKPYLTYLSHSNELTYFDTKNPFSQIGFIGEATGEKNRVGQILNFLYTRNIGKEINITGLFDFVSSDGQYANQSVTQSLLGLNVSIEKKRYKHYASIERLQFKIQENGGVRDDSEAINSPKSYTSTIGVNLSKATSQTNIVRVKGYQFLNLFSGSSGDTLDTLPSANDYEKFKPALIHSYNYTSAKRLFNDEFSSLDFYPDSLINGSITEDSVQHHSFINDVNLRISGQLKDTSDWFVETGLHHEILHFYSYDGSTWKQGLGLGANARIGLNRAILSGKGRIMFAGYQAGDHLMSLRAKFLSPKKNNGPEIRVMSKAFSPDLFVSRYMGNHFKWENDFSKQIEQGVGVTLDIAKWNFTFDADIKIITNWIYFNSLAHPDQRESSAIMASSGIGKTFIAGPFRSRNSVYLNYTNAEEIPLPLLIASSSTFMHHDIYFRKTNGLLQLEYGFDVRFSTGYEGFAYMPATGVFYLQEEQVLGNYPVLDLFLIMRVKRTRFFVRWDHVNSGFTGDNIFPVLHYPLKQRNIKYGIYWHFHD